MAFVSSGPVSAATLHFHTCRVCAWRGDQSLIGRWSLFRGESVSRRLSVRISQEEKRTRTTPTALLGGGGFLGVGSSELVVILLVGWLLLGPEKLFSLAKDTGKVLGELRRTANQAKEQFDEALELDLLASEMKQTQDTSLPPGDAIVSEMDKVKDNGASEELQTSELVEELSVPRSPSEPEVIAKQDAEVDNSAFLDQLQRVADPNQIAPGEVPDLEVDEEEELRKLEQQYLEARERLARRKLGKEDAQGQSENKSVIGER